MQNELLIEIFTEEMPARIQKRARKDASSLIYDILISHNSVFEKVSTYISTRRLAFQVSGLQPITKSFSECKRGPKIGAPDIAIDGFCNSNSKTRSDLEENDGYFYLRIETNGEDVINIIPQVIKEFIEKMPWPKTMRWYIEQHKILSLPWIRPIRSILCIYDGALVEAEMRSVGLRFSDYTYGHRFLSSDLIRVFDFDDYAYKLEKNYVMIDMDKKRAIIDRDLSQAAANTGLCLHMDDELLDEVTGLVEYPFVHIGNIEEKFMDLPPQVLSTSMKIHQKYFTLTYPDSVIAPFFGTVTNVPGNDVMYKGLEKVLKARLSDALFFFEEDNKIPLEALSQRLSSVVFQEKLGSVGNKIERLLTLATNKEESRVILLAKADLLTQMVGEFPELQGTMGEIYAKLQGEQECIATAIREHYKPLGANDELPNTALGATISFFDKLDTIVGFIGIGILPTGSKDPYSLRRSALGIIRILCDFEINILRDYTLSQYIDKIIETYSDQSIALDMMTKENVIEFIFERFKGVMTTQYSIDAACSDAILESYKGGDIDFRDAVRRIVKLFDIMKTAQFELINTSYKRASGILLSAQIDLPEDSLSDISYSDEFLKKSQEMLLSLISSNKEDLNSIVGVSEAIMKACENTLILNQDKKVRNNNLILLKEFIKYVNNSLGVLENL